MTRTVLVFAVALLLSAVLVHGGNYLCRLSEEDMIKAMDCIHRTVKPEVAKFMERLPGYGIGHIRSLCRLGSDIVRGFAHIALILVGFYFCFLFITF
ncbi:unnamed protein product [Ixodes persulcatus]